MGWPGIMMQRWSKKINLLNSLCRGPQWVYLDMCKLFSWWTQWWVWCGQTRGISAVPLPLLYPRCTSLLYPLLYLLYPLVYPLLYLTLIPNSSLNSSSWYILSYFWVTCGHFWVTIGQYYNSRSEVLNATTVSQILCWCKWPCTNQTKTWTHEMRKGSKRAGHGQFERGSGRKMRRTGRRKVWVVHRMPYLFSAPNPPASPWTFSSKIAGIQ